MKTARKKDESEIDKIKRESIEWLENYPSAPSFIRIAIDDYTSQFHPDKDKVIQILNNWINESGSIDCDWEVDIIADEICKIGGKK